MKFLIALLFPALSSAAIWPETFGNFNRTSLAPVEISDRPLWEEYGFQQGERARYESGGRQFTATAYRFQDSTGAMAAFDWQRPDGAKPSKLGPLAAETPRIVTLAHGNYLLVFDGHKPDLAELSALFETVPKLDQSPLPTLRDYLPAGKLISGSERYVVGPVSLEKFEPDVPPSIAAFHLGAEAQLGSYRTPAGEMKLAIFSYPTPQIARGRLEDFLRISGAIAKRSGPLVAVILAAPNADEAERLLAQVRYEASITMSERVPTQRDNIGNLIINIFELIGILLVLCTVGGLAVGGFRTILRRGGGFKEPEGMISLHLSDR